MIPALAFLPPWAWRIAAYAAVAVAIYGMGYVNGLHKQELLDERRFTEIRITQDQQALHAGRIALERNAQINAVVNSHEIEKRRLAGIYARRLRAAAAHRDAGAVPGGAVPEGADAGAADEGTACAVRLADLEGRCAETTLMLVNLQKAARAVEETR